MLQKPAESANHRDRSLKGGSRARPLAPHPGEGIALLVLMSVAAGVRMLAWHRTAVLFNDGPIFIALSDAWLEGRFPELLAHPYHPLYPGAIAVETPTFGLEPETAAVAVSVLGGLLAVLGIGLAVRWAFDRSAGWMAAWTVVLHPWAVDFSSDVMSDGLYGGLFLLGFASLVAWQRNPTRLNALGVGVLAGLAYLVRPEGLGLLVVAAGVAAFCAWRRPSDRGRFARTGLLGLVAALLVMGPYLIALQEQVGDWTLTRKKSLSDLAEGRAGVQLEVVTPQRPRDLRAAEKVARPAADRSIPLPRSSERLDHESYDRPPRTVLGFAEAVVRALRTSLAAFRYEVAAFALAGFFALRRRRVSERSLTFGLPALAYGGLLVILVWGAGYVARRHALPAALPLTAYAVLGWRWAVDQMPFSRRFGARGAAFLLVITLLLVWGPRDLRERRADRIPVLAAAAWLAGHEPSRPVVAAQKMRVAYYAGGRHVPLPSGRETPLHGQLRRAGVQWVVIDEQRLGDHLGLAEGIGDWLEPVHEEQAGGRRVLVLRMR